MTYHLPIKLSFLCFKSAEDGVIFIKNLRCHNDFLKEMNDIVKKRFKREC